MGNRDRWRTHRRARSSVCSADELERVGASAVTPPVAPKDDDMRPEYDFSKAARAKYADRFREGVKRERKWWRRLWTWFTQHP